MTDTSALPPDAVAPSGTDAEPTPPQTGTAVDVAPTPGALATRTEWDEMAEAFDDGSNDFVKHFGLSLPRLRSDFGRNGKGWVDDLTGDAYDHLSIVILAMPPSRAWWEKSIDEGGGGPPDCRSINMITPTDDSDKQAPTCAACPKSKWGEDNERPACADSVNVVAFDLEVGQFVWLRFGGTALKPYRDYVSALRSRGLKHFQVATTIKLEERTRDKLEWLVPHFQIGDALSADQVRPMREIAQKAKESFDQVAQEMATQARATEDGPFDGDNAGGTPKGTVDMGPGEEPF